MEVVSRKYSHKDTGWRLFLKTIIARAYPRIIGQQREISWEKFELFLQKYALPTPRIVHNI